jgi:ribonuclease R
MTRDHIARQPRRRQPGFDPAALIFIAGSPTDPPLNGRQCLGLTLPEAMTALQCPSPSNKIYRHKTATRSYPLPSNKYTDRILSFIKAKDYRPKKVRELAEAMGIGLEEMGDFHDACRAMMRTGRIVLGAKNAVMLPARSDRVVGTFRLNPRGFGFVVPSTPSDHGDLFVPPGSTGGAITGDTVSAKVLKKGKRSGKMIFEGRISDILQRGQSRFVGELRSGFNRWFVVPDGNTLHVPIVVDDPSAKGGKSGDQVVVEILTYPTERTDARGVVVKVLGKRGQPDVETQSIIEQFQLPQEFNEEVLAETREVVDAYDAAREAKEREDLRKLTIITIDPEDARDFDDAISLTESSDGTFELGVHIADVAHFVRDGGALDTEARDRANSIYLPGTVIPMLPELLSNGVCSLQERQPRLTKSVFITYDKAGKVKATRFANTVIKSTKRLTYEQATRVIEGKPGRMSAKVVSLLKSMERLARIIRERRLRDGMLELDLPEVELVFDDEGRPVNVEPADTSFSHKIIEMFMVEANEALAELFNKLNIPALRRIHDDPEDLSDGSLREFLRVLGHNLPKNADRFDLQTLLDEVRGHDDAFAVHLAILKSMKQAEYSPKQIGHYALASKHYTHFTSPIRRYPDLTIHRLLARYLRGDFKHSRDRWDIEDEAELTQLGSLCSANERRAEAAERELKLVFILKMLEKRIGDQFAGIVTGIANIGAFVQIEHYLIDGLLPFDQLPEDWWEVDATRCAAVGQRTGHRITVGDRLKVVINRVHLPTRQLELALSEPLIGRRKPNTETDSPKRGKRKAPAPRKRPAGSRSNRKTNRRRR